MKSNKNTDIVGVWLFFFLGFVSYKFYKSEKQKVHQHATELTTAYHKIYSIQREVKHSEYLKNKNPKIKTFLSFHRTSGKSQEEQKTDTSVVSKKQVQESPF